jgi:hypothetical protein
MAKSASQIRMDLKRELHDELYDFLVCQKCEEVKKEGSIYTCDSGDHATCNDCFQISQVCKCMASIKHRNKAWEKMRTTLPLSCKFRKNGCTSVLSLGSLAYHEVDCQCRPIFCPDLVCKNKIMFYWLDNHLTERHAALANEVCESFLEYCFIGLTEDFLKFTKAAWVPSKISLNGAQFFRVMVLQNERFYIWTYYYGSKEEAKNYNCTIKVYGGPDNEQFTYDSPPRSLDESRDQVIDGDCCLSVSLCQVQRLVSDGKLNCSVKISCPKEEARDDDVESGCSY